MQTDDFPSGDWTREAVAKLRAARGFPPISPEVWAALAPSIDTKAWRPRDAADWQVHETTAGRKAIAEVHDAAVELRDYAALLLDPAFRKTAAGEMRATSGRAAAECLLAAVARMSCAVDDAAQYVTFRPSEDAT